MSEKKVSKLSVTLQLIVFVLVSNTVRAQSIIYDQTDIFKYYQSDCYDENINFFPSIACSDSIKGTFNLLPIYSNNLYNTRYAKSINDGPAWGGRGFNTTLGFGFSGRIGNFSYVINPIIHYSENKAFYIGSDLTASPEYQYPYYRDRIDLVSRYGDEPYFVIAPGQSEIKFELEPVEFSLSTQNMRWGPALYNPVIMSTNAPGFPHLRIGTSRPLHSTIGDFEINVFWGLLRESDYFNDDPDDDWRYFTGMSFGYAPSFWDGFSIGVNRVFYTQKRYITNFFKSGTVLFTKGFFDETRVRQPDGSVTNDIYDQIISGTLQWKDEEDNFRIYMEIFRGDFASGLVLLLEQPEHNAGYMYGLVKKFEMKKDRSMIFTYEHSELATWETSAQSAGPTIYTHHINKQGYSNYGQVLGASIGPGSQGDMATLTYFWKKYFLMLEYQRSRYNDDYFYLNFTDRNGPTPQDIEHQVGLKFSGWYSNIEYTISSEYAHRDNYLFEDDIIFQNVHSYITLRYHF